VDNGSPHHMTGMRLVVLNFLESDIYFFVGSGTNTRKSIREYGYVRFHLKSRGFMRIEHMLYVPELKVNLLSIATFEDGSYVVAFKNGQVDMYSRESTPDMTIVFGILKERLYMLL
jgi:hypothetical protein